METVTNVEPLLRYIELSDPRQLWRSAFASDPEHSDIDDGEHSGAVIAMEELLTSLAEETRSVDIGCPVEYGPVPLGDKGVELLRKKLLSAFILHSTSAQCLKKVQSSPRTIRDDFAPGVVAVVADTIEMPPVMKALNIDSSVAVDMLQFSDGSRHRSPICLAHGEPEVRIHIRSHAEIQQRCGTLVDQTVAALLTGQKDVFDPDIFVSGDNLSFPGHIRFGDDDERARLNAILEFAGERIDADGGDLADIVKHAPFRRTLTQKLATRILDYLEDAFERYGFEQQGFKMEGGCMSARFTEASGVLPVMYRLLGDIEDDLEGLLMPEMCSFAQVMLPCFPEKSPEVIILPPVDHIIADYCELRGGADACITLRSHGRQVPKEADLGKMFPVVASTRIALSEVAEEIRKIFTNDIISRGNS